jgi:FlaA1/EpsC-like NDP-sugar epimerase
MASIKRPISVANAASLRRPAALIVGDACMFLIFSAVGRASHHEAAGLDAFLLIVQTAAPFAFGWFVVAPFFGVYRQSVTGSARSMLLRTALAWLCAWPAGLLLRWLFTQQVPPVSFAIVTLLANLLFLGIWRGLFALVANRSR